MFCRKLKIFAFLQKLYRKLSRKLSGQFLFFFVRIDLRKTIFETVFDIGLTDMGLSSVGIGLIRYRIKIPLVRQIFMQYRTKLCRYRISATNFFDVAPTYAEFTARGPQNLYICCSSALCSVGVLLTHSALFAASR
jgi:hypothetical protein